MALDERLNLLPKLFPGIFRIELRQFPQQFFRFFVVRHRHGNFHFDNLVPALSILSRRRYTFLAQPQLLPRLRSRRNLQRAAAIDGRHFDLRSERRLHRRDRHGNVNVVALASENWVWVSPDDHVEVARRSAAQAGISFSGYANPLPIARARLDANLKRLGTLHRAFTMAHRTRRNIFPRPMTPRTSHVELHPPAGLLNRPFALALRTNPRRLDVAIPMTVPANIATRNVKAHHTTANRRPEGSVDLVFEIVARFRPAVLGRSATSPAGKNIRENIAEAPTAARSFASATAPAFEHVGEVESAKIKVDTARARRFSPLRPGKSVESARARLSSASRIGLSRRRINVVGIKPELIVNFALLGIAQDVVRFGDSLELLLRTLIAGIDVRMVL